MSDRDIPDPDVKTPGERTRERAEYGRERYRKSVIRESIQVANEALAVGDHHRVSCLLRDKLIPALRLDEWSLDHYHLQLTEENLPWDWDSITRYMERPDAITTTLATGDGHSRTKRLRLRAAGGMSPREVAEDITEGAFDSVESIAKHEGYIPTELSNQTRVLGHTLRLGTLFQPWERESPDSINLIKPDGHPPITCIQGLPGFGKSTLIETIAEDRIASRYDPHRDTHKVMEFDLDELEGGLYDVPSERGDLVSIREENDVPVWWDEIDMESVLLKRSEEEGRTITESDWEYISETPAEPPNVEIMVPLSRGLEESEVPYDTDRDGWDVTPFTIPASGLNRRALNTLLSHTTDVQANFLERAYQQANQLDDWTLSDLSEEIWRTDATEGVKKRLENALRNLQNVGFIRDRDSPYCLDWGEVMRDTDTVSVFTTSLMEDTAQKMMVMSYLLNAVYEERKARRNLPRLHLAMRELHFYAPTDRAAKEDETERDLQDAMSAELQEVAARHRHEDIEINSDSQQFAGQIKKRIRDHIERVITFRAHRNNVDEVFRSLIGGDNDTYVNKISRNFNIGQAAAVGYTGSNRPFEMPIKAFPPMSHHYDARREDSGWTVRVDALDHLEFRDSPWSAEVPDRLKFSNGSRKPRDPVGKFVFECISKEGNATWEPLEEVYGAYLEYARENDHDVLSKVQFGKKYLESFNTDAENKRKMINGVNFRRYTATKLNKSGMEWRDTHRDRHKPGPCPECGAAGDALRYEDPPVVGWVCEECEEWTTLREARGEVKT